MYLLKHVHGRERWAKNSPFLEIWKCEELKRSLSHLLDLGAASRLVRDQVNRAETLRGKQKNSADGRSCFKEKKALDLFI